MLDFVGSNDSLAEAARLVDRQGIAIVIGLFGGRIPFGLGAVPHEAHFMSSIWGSRDELAELIELAQRERLEYTSTRCRSSPRRRHTISCVVGRPGGGSCSSPRKTYGFSYYRLPADEGGA